MRESNGVNARVARFRELHAAGCFVMPNPWDIGSARLLASLGFPALATTSAGMSWSMGRRDNRVGIEAALAHIAAMAAAVEVPVNADFEGAFAIEPADVHANILRGTATGVAGLSIEDSTGQPDAPLFPFELAVERVRAARRAIDESGSGIVLTGRSEGFFVGRPDLTETIRRLTAYADAGADCLYAPGIRSVDELAQVVAAVAPRPVNALVSGDFTTVGALAAIGVRRISTGGALARVAFGALARAAGEIACSGTFGAMTGAIAVAELERTFRPDAVYTST